MPRYVIALTASNGEARTCARKMWARTDGEATEFAVSWLAALRATRRDCAALDEWEVFDDAYPASARKSVAAGRIRARA